MPAVINAHLIAFGHKDQVWYGVFDVDNRLLRLDSSLLFYGVGDGMMSVDDGEMAI